MRDDQEEVARRVVQRFEPYFTLTIQRAWRRWMGLSPADKRALTHPRCQANTIWGFIVDEAQAVFAEVPGARGEARGGTYNLHLDGKVLVRFKKRGRRRAFSMIPTQLALRFFEQLTIPGMPEEIRVIVSYKPNPTLTSVDSIMITCPKGSRILWEYAIPTEVAASFLEPVDGPPAPVPASARARAKARSRQEIQKDRDAAS